MDPSTSRASSVGYGSSDLALEYNDRHDTSPSSIQMPIATRFRVSCQVSAFLVGL